MTPVSPLLARFLLLAIAPIAIWAAESAEEESGKLLADVSSRGASKIVEELYAPGGRWPEVMAKISGGSADWLKVAVALHPGTDAGASEELDQAMFLALGVAPEAVLRLLEQHEFSVEYVCSSNISVDYPVDQSTQFVNDRLKALDRVKEASLSNIKGQCELGLQQALRDLDRIGQDR
jgi:hypothetical protein